MKPIKALLIYNCMAGFIALAVTLLVSSQGRHFALGQLNSSRIVAIFVLVFLLFSLVGTWWTWRSERQVESWLIILDKWFAEEKRLAPALLVLATFSLVGFAAIAAVLLAGRDPGAAPLWAPATFSLLHTLVVRSLPLSLWGLGSLIGLGILLTWRYRANVRRRETWSWTHLAGVSLGLACIVAMLFHWMTLLFQLRFFANNPAWYWTIEFKPFTWTDLWYVLIAGLMSACLYWALFMKKNTGLALLVIFLLGLFLQVGLEYRQGNGLTALRDKYFSTYHSAYPLNASQSHRTILETVREYEMLYGDRAFTNTKPPGLIAGYMWLERLVNGWGKYTDDVRYTRFSWAITYGFPVISMSMVFLLYAFSRRFLEPSAALFPILAALFFVLSPNIILFPLFPDQAIYPLLFLSLVWLTVWTVEKQSFFWALLLGAVLYAAVFVAFTMLPLYPIALFFLGVSFLMNRKLWNVRDLLKVVLGIAAGSLLLYIVFLFAFNYDFLSRFGKMVAINHNFDFYLRVGQKIPDGPESLSTRVRQILNAAWINNLDFAAAVGFPIYILFMVYGIRLLLQALRKKITNGKGVLLALFLGFLLLNLAGTAQGEVARLWMFWVPMVVLFAALEVEGYVRKMPSLVFLLVLIQVGTVFLTYHFQDFHM
jgi:hypothetical protein